MGGGLGRASDASTRESDASIAASLDAMSNATSASIASTSAVTVSLASAASASIASAVTVASTATVVSTSTASAPTVASTASAASTFAASAAEASAAFPASTASASTSVSTSASASTASAAFASASASTASAPTSASTPASTSTSAASASASTAATSVAAAVTARCLEGGPLAAVAERELEGGVPRCRPCEVSARGLGNVRLSVRAPNTVDQPRRIRGKVAQAKAKLLLFLAEKHIIRRSEQPRRRHVAVHALDSSDATCAVQLSAPNARDERAVEVFGIRQQPPFPRDGVDPEGVAQHPPHAATAQIPAIAGSVAGGGGRRACQDRVPSGVEVDGYRDRRLITVVPIASRRAIVDDDGV
eukprot:3952731-Prymnesium_polylepis.1